MESKRIKVVAAVLTDGAGRYLMGQRNPDRIAAAKWEFPGGKVEVGEDLKRALKREILEELGDEVELFDLVCAPVKHDYPWGKVELYFFLGQLKSHHLKQVAASQFVWGTPKELLELDVLPASKVVLEELKDAK